MFGEQTRKEAAKAKRESPSAAGKAGGRARSNVGPDSVSRSTSQGEVAIAWPRFQVQAIRLKEGQKRALMTREQRLDMSARLQRENAESHAWLERRARDRAADPLRFEIVADARDSQDPSDLHFTAPCETHP